MFTSPPKFLSVLWRRKLSIGPESDRYVLTIERVLSILIKYKEIYKKIVLFCFKENIVFKEFYHDISSVWPGLGGRQEWRTDISGE